ncbi:MAG TPA: WD40 repeat domain-containing protein, partial [Polyangia bacterium]
MVRVRTVVGALVTLFAAAAGIAVTAATLKAPVAVWAPLAGLWLLCAAAVLVLTVVEQRQKAAAERALTNAALAGHFEPRSRGADLGEPGWYFTGRERAIRELSAWLMAGDDAKTRVVTGEPGGGKSALIGRLVMLSDPRRRQEILAHEPDLAAELRFKERVIDVAVNATNKTSEQVADEIATTLGLAERLPALVVEALNRGNGRRRIVVDSLDEADDPHELIAALLSPLGRSPRAQLLVGTRKPYVRALGGDDANVVLDLDPNAKDYFEHGDVVAYVNRRLGGRGNYPDPRLAEQVAEAIAARAGGNFLIAQIVARDRADRPPDTTAPEWQNHLPTSVGEAMDQDLRRLADKQRPVRELLLALAYAEGSGLPRHGGIWEATAGALTGTGDRRLSDVFGDRRALAYLIGQIEDGLHVYRLYHRALAEHLQATDGPDDAQARITTALTKLVPRAAGATGRDWASAPPYVRVHLATHAAAGGILDHLLEEACYLTAADPPRLLQALPAASSPVAVSIRRVYRLAVHHLGDVVPAERAAYLEMAARLLRAGALADQIAQCSPNRPWMVRWAQWRADPEHFVVGRHIGRVGAVAVAELDGRAIAVSGGSGGTLRVWDLAAGAPIGEPLGGHTGFVGAVAVGELDGRAIAVSGSDDQTVRVWDLAAGAPIGEPLGGHTGFVGVGFAGAVAVGELGGRAIAVSGGTDGTLRMWDLDAGAPIGAPLKGHTGAVMAVAVGELDGRAIAVSSGDDETLRVWDLAARAPIGEPLRGHTGGVGAVAVGELDGRAIAVSGGDDETLRVWDLAA